jgi:hypothetical protein
MSRKLEGAMFASRTTERPRFYSNAGSRERNDYQIQIDMKGHKVLKKVGSHDIYQEIQSYAEECKIENILARAAAGDVAALNQRNGFYADITDSPKTLAEAQNEILKLSAYFDSLPAEIRAKFDNSKERFVHLYGTNEFLDLMGFKTEETTKTEQQNFTPEAANAEKVLTPEGNK